VAFELDGWAGDHAGSVVGREPNTLLTALTTSDPSSAPVGLSQKADLDGTPWYVYCWVECLTPNARHAIATEITRLGEANVFEIEVTEVDWGDGKDAWAAGVHLFGVSLAEGHNRCATIATAVITDTVRRLDPRATHDLLGRSLWDLRGGTWR
jgi:hypothetical protein